MAKAKDLEEALTNIETKLGGSEKPHMDLGEHLEYIESLIGGGGPGGGNIDDVKVNGTSVVKDKTADIKLKTINNEDITGEGNIDIQGGGIDSNIWVNLEYGVSNVFNVLAPEELASAADYAEFFNSFLNKQILVSIADSAEEEKYSTTTSLVSEVNYVEQEGRVTIILYTPFGDIISTVQNGDKGEPVSFYVDWSQAVDWSSTGGSSGGDSDGKIGYVATFGFPFIEDSAPKVSFWLTNAQVKELEELSGSAIQDIIDHWSSINKSIVIPALFNHSLQAKIWPDGTDGDSYPCNITYAFNGESDVELYFVYLDRGSQHQRIIVYGDDINSITLNIDEWTGGGSGGTVDTDKLISINMTNMDCTGIDDNGGENRIIRDLQLYCTKERWDNFVSLASSMMGVDITYTNFDSVFKTLSVSQQATAIGYLLMDYYSGKILPEAYLQRNVNTQGFSGKGKYGIVDLTTLTDPQSGIEFVWDCQFRGSATSGDRSEVGTIPSPDIGETNYYTNDTVITVQEVEGAAIASSGGGGSSDSEVSQDYLISLSNKLGHNIYPIKKIIENDNEYDPQELQEHNFNSELYLRGDKFMSIVVPGNNWSNVGIEILDSSKNSLCLLESFTHFLPIDSTDYDGNRYTIVNLTVNQDIEDIDPQEIIISISHQEE